MRLRIPFLRRAKAADDDLFAMLDDKGLWDDFEDVVSEVLETEAVQAANAAIEAAGVYVDASLTADAVAEYAATYATEWTDNLVASTRDALREALAAYARGEIEYSELQSRIAYLFSPDRAALIAATEVTRIFGYGSLLAFELAGVKAWDWEDVADGRVCPTCVGHAMGGPYAIGKGPAFPAHPGCRCWPSPA